MLATNLHFSLPMKKAFKIVGFILMGIAILAGLGASYIGVKGVPSYPYAPTPEIAALQVPRGDTAMIERGKKIASMLCNGCHLGEDGKLSGSPRTDLPAMFGNVVSLNITQDPIHGIGNWTDGELYYLLRTGIRKDGSWAPPFMPKFPAVADSDLKSIIAWLRSNDPDVAPSQKEYPPNQWNFLVRFLSNTAFSAPPLPSGPITIPDSTDKIALGRYLADGLLSCYACHSGDFTKLNDQNPSQSFRYYGGGNPLLNMEGQTVPSANITMDRETGIGAWTEEEFINAVKYCKKPDGGALSYPMPPHAGLTDGEVKAIYAFLKTVPPINFKVDRYK
jgi:mono/diheme cytochrome c family protein